MKFLPPDAACCEGQPKCGRWWPSRRCPSSTGKQLQCGSRAAAQPSQPQALLLYSWVPQPEHPQQPLLLPVRCVGRVKVRVVDCCPGVVDAVWYCGRACQQSCMHKAECTAAENW